MNIPEEQFELPTKDLLFKIDTDRASQCHLMPGHWALYAHLLKTANDDNIICGSHIPDSSDPLFEDLHTKGIIIQNPISYDYWMNMQSTEEPPQKENNTPPEAIQQEENFVVQGEPPLEKEPQKIVFQRTETIVNGSAPQLEDDITAVSATSNNSATEVDLDFLD